VELKISLKDSNNAKKTNEAEKKVEKKPDKREEKKLNLQETGFRMVFTCPPLSFLNF